MKTMKKLMALCLSLVMIISCIPAVYAASTENSVESPGYLINPDAHGSITLYKYDLTGAEKDGVWDSSYVSTGIYDSTINDTLGGAVRDGDNDNKSNLGNGGESFGYAIKGVEFTYLKVAQIVQFSETADNATTKHILYGFDKTASANLLKAIGLENGANHFAAADDLDTSKYFYESNVLIDALQNALDANATTVKNALEQYVANGGTAMPLTNSYGKTSAVDLELGLYLIVETKVPEMVVATCNPFFVSIPMTNVSGGNAEDGGTAWSYDITLYPKNATSNPSLEKTLRENQSDTGNNDGSSDDIKDGYAHTGTASDGDVIDYQLVSTLPAITSEATYLSAYTFIDTLSAGLSYNKNDVVVTFYKDAACTDLITTWTQNDGKFTVSYGTAENKASTMTIEMTEQGLKEINTAKTVYTGVSMTNSGYSDCTVRITYQATMHTDDSVIYGDAGNPNDVVLLWKRSSSEYYDTLVDDAHVFTYGMELTKTFSDGKGDFSKVEFILKNETDGYYVKAELNAQEGVYYVVDHVADKKDATRFIPIEQGENAGLVFVKGLEDDAYVCTEVRTADGYTLLKDDIKIVISNVEATELCDIYASDVLGLIQNDPRFADVQVGTGAAQRHLEHHLLTASATVDGNKVNMKEDDGSKNATAPLKVVNTNGFDLPQTGDRGTWMFSVIGILLMAGAAAAIVIVSRKSRTNRR